MVTTANGTIASFKSPGKVPIQNLKINFMPKQDLHGYSQPWAGGNGKNKLNPATYTKSNPYTIHDVTWTLNSDGTVLANGTASAANTTVSFAIQVNTDTDYYFYVDTGGATGCEAYVWDSTTSARCTKWDGTTASGDSRSTLQEVKLIAGHSIALQLRVVSGYTANNVLFKPMLLASTETNVTWEPYENLCPITGWTEININQCGKNLIDKTKLSQYEVIQSDGTSIFTYPSARATDYIKIKDGKCVLTIDAADDATSSSSSIRCILYDENKQFIRRQTSSSRINGRTYLYMNDQSCKYVRINFFISTEDPETPMLELGTNITDYEDYNGTTFPISWESQFGTIYGGYIDLINGDLVAEWKSIKIKDLVFTEYETSYSRFRSSISGIKTGATRTVQIYSSCFLPICDGRSINDVPNNSVYIAGLSEGILFKTTDYTDIEEFQSIYGEEEIVYPLKNPITYKLSSQTIKTLIGRNNIWGENCDNAEVTYNFTESLDMIRTRQKVLKASSIYKTELPPGYQKCDYLQTVSHNCRIDSGVTGEDTTLKIEFDWMIVKNESNGSYYGAFGNASWGNGWKLVRNTASSDSDFTKILVYAGTSSAIEFEPNGTGNPIYNQKLHCIFEHGKAEINGIVKTGTKGTITGGNIYFGTTSPTSSGIAGHIGRWWYIKMWSNGILVRYYIPAIRLSDNKAGFYDMVNYTFNPSIGTAEFTAGNDT